MRVRNLIALAHVETGRGPTQTPVRWVTGLFAKVKGPGCDDVFISTKYRGLQTGYCDVSFPFLERSKMKVNFGLVIVTFYYPTKKKY